MKNYQELQDITFTYSLKGIDRAALVCVLLAVKSSVKLTKPHLLCTLRKTQVLYTLRKTQGSRYGLINKNLVPMTVRYMFRECTPVRECTFVIFIKLDDPYENSIHNKTTFRTEPKITTTTIHILVKMLGIHGFSNLTNGPGCPTS